MLLKWLRALGPATARAVWSSPGAVAAVCAYGGVCGGLYWMTYGHLWALVAAAVVGGTWYMSPLGRWEAERARRLARVRDQEARGDAIMRGGRDRDGAAH